MEPISTTCTWRSKQLHLSAEMLQAVSDPSALLKRLPFALPARTLYRAAERAFEAIILENEYLELTLLPQPGLRLHRVRFKHSGRDLFYFEPTIAPVYHSQFRIWIPGGLQFDTGTSDLPFSPRPCRVDSSQPRQLTVWMGESDRRRSLHWAVGIRLRDGSRAFEVEVRVHNTGKERHPCRFASCATVPWSNSPELLRVDEDSDGAVATPYVLYDYEEDEGLLHLCDSLPAPARSLHAPDDRWLAAPDAMKGARQPYLRFLVEHREDGEAPPVLKPGEGTCWIETWVPFSGTGGVTSVNNPLILHLGPTPTAATPSPLNQNPALYDFSDPALEQDAPEFESWTLSAAAWDAVMPVEVSVDVDGQDIWTGKVSPPPGEIDQVEIRLAASTQNQPTLRLTPTALHYPSSGDMAGLSPGLTALETLDALNADPGTFIKQVHTAALDFRQGNVDEGRADLLHGALELSPGALYPRCALLALDLRNGVGDDTASQIEALIRAAPLDPVIRWLETLPAVITGQESVHPVIQSPGNPLFPQDEQEHRTEFQWVFEAGEALAALGLLEALTPLEIAARNGLPLAAYHRALWSVENGQEEEAREWLSLAETAIPGTTVPATKRDYASLCTAVRLQPGSPAASYYLGVWRLTHGEPETALPLLRIGVDSGQPWSKNASVIQMLAACLWRRQLFGTSSTSPPSDEDCAEAASLLDRAIASNPRDVDLLLERDELAETMMDDPAVRLERLQSAPLELRCAVEVTARLAALMLQLDQFSDAITVLVEGVGLGDGLLLGGLYVDALLGRALSQMQRWEMEAALDDVERALDYSSSRLTRTNEHASSAELLWWAGLCCHRMGRGYHARSYWQGAAAERPQTLSIHAVSQALAVRALGGFMQGQALLEDTLAAAESLEAADYTGSADTIASETEAAFCRAVALFALGDVRAGASKLEMLELTTPGFHRARWYRAALAAGMLDGI